MNETEPWFVKITGPMQWQIKPYAWQGWAMIGLWMVLLWAIMALLFLDGIRERWWIVLILSGAITVALIILCIQMAVPIEQLRAGEKGRRRRGRPKKES